MAEEKKCRGGFQYTLITHHRNNEAESDPDDNVVPPAPIPNKDADVDTELPDSTSWIVLVVLRSSLTSKADATKERRIF